MKRPSRRVIFVALLLAAALILVGALRWASRFPPDTTAQGVYLRIAYNMARSDERICFAYLEDRAQHAAYTIREYRKKASERITSTYPEPERSRLLEAYRAHAVAEDGADVWLDMARKRGSLARLRSDLSGIAKMESQGERATIETVRGARYTFRKRENGIWGLTLFTAELVAEAERAARDWEIVERTAMDYERAK